ncbi:FAD-binding and (Fe-S)-binding domain-containing protein [Emticicia sp. 17c]|uniref:FAD-binding and (Fe-S)-binding domain-containing protein n=1 Tax=Emticicia sp. 17c TaxID=3127704 RepID=UPI00301D5A86
MFESLLKAFEGELYFRNTTTDEAIRAVYATDASVYQEKPLAVALPKSVQDIRQLIRFAQENALTLIPRAAGTSLAGQVVGQGLVVDVSKNFRQILEVNRTEKWVRVQPGVIRDDLNAHLKPYGLMFGPETSTSSRAMIGGMIGNNSCGLHSIIWGSTRDNLLEVTALLADGSQAVFGAITAHELQEKCALNNAEGAIYRQLSALINDAGNRAAINEGFPKKSITRRNTGYALDIIADMWQFEKDQPLNLSSLIAGSEGTLCLVTEAKLKLIDLPPAQAGMVAVHTISLHEALLANLIALRHGCAASELVDDFILEFTKTNIEQSKNRFFIEGGPKAILMVEFFAETEADIREKAEKLIAELKASQLGYAYPILLQDDAKKAWDVRKGGLGLLRNLPGDTQPVNLIEDCAVDVADLPAYIAELEVLLKNHGVQYSMYAHAGAGELHVEPMINLKKSEGQQLFRTILAETAALVKKYGGSLSGEHGDGRLRGEFIPFMMGEKNYALFREVKRIFDPQGLFNQGKIVDTPPMNAFMRYVPDQPVGLPTTVFDFSGQENMLRLAEKCSGSGDCRKTEITGGTMCPSYMATRSERDTTRARANILRQYLTQPAANKVGMEETKEILDLCLSCKACKSECPSSVDIAKMKGEFLQSYYDTNGVPFRSKLIGTFTKQMRLAMLAPWAYNFIFKTNFTRRIANRVVGFHPERTMPLLHKQTLRKWYEQSAEVRGFRSDKKVYLFCDEFTNYNDVRIGQQLILLLQQLGYEVIIPAHTESGRTYLSKGMVREAQKIAIQNVNRLKELVKAETPIIGIEPSAILTLKDEYLELVPAHLQEAAQQLAQHTFIFEEWFAREIDRGNIKKEAFSTEKRLIKLHGHCHQKALSSLTPTKKSLSLPANYEVHLIPSGCCGMAGSFGYEAEHYEVSMKIGELVLFPTVRKQPDDVIIAAPGTSCRHQIKDGTGRIAQHPVEILYEALVK